MKNKSSLLLVICSVVLSSCGGGGGGSNGGSGQSSSSGSGVSPDTLSAGQVLKVTLQSENVPGQELVEEYQITQGGNSGLCYFLGGTSRYTYQKTGSNTATFSTGKTGSYGAYGAQAVSIMVDMMFTSENSGTCRSNTGSGDSYSGYNGFGMNGTFTITGGSSSSSGGSSYTPSGGSSSSSGGSFYTPPLQQNSPAPASLGDKVLELDSVASNGLKMIYFRGDGSYSDNLGKSGTYSYCVTGASEAVIELTRTVYVFDNEKLPSTAKDTINLRFGMNNQCYVSGRLRAWSSWNTAATSNLTDASATLK